MPDEIEIKVDTTKTEPPKPEAKVEAPKVEAKPDAKADEKAAPDAKADVTKKPEAKAKGAAESEDDTPEVGEDNMVKMPLRDFMRRVSRMTKKEMKKKFGTDDFDAIVAEREELKTLREDRAKREREAMSEKERLEADKKAAEARAQEAETRAERAEESRMAERFENTVSTVAAEYVDKADVDDVLDRLARRIERHPEEFPPGKKGKDAVDSWFKDFVEKHPKYAKGAPAGETKAEEKKADEVKVEQKTKVIDTSIQRNRPPGQKPARAIPEGKTARPGQPNSMTREELKRAGYNW